MAAVARVLSRAFLPTYLLFLLPARWLGRLVQQRTGDVVQAGSAGLWQQLRKHAQRRQVLQLSDAQLRDTGIDPAMAGRGRAAEVRAEAVRYLDSLAAH